MNTSNQPLRILHIVPNMQAGGLETFIMNIYRKLDRSKFQFDFLVHYKDTKFYDDEIKKLGGNIYYFTLRDDNNIFKYAHRLNQFYKKHPEYRIVHCHMESISVLHLIIAAKNGVRVRISHSHSDRYGRGIKGVIKHFLSLPTKYISTKRFACSDAAGQRLFRKRTYTIIPNAIDINKFSFNPKKRADFRAKYKISRQQLAIGHMARFDQEKNHIYILKIFQQILQQRPDSMLILAGNGRLKDKIVELSKRMNINNSILFLGNIHDVCALYSGIDVFIMPSIFEGIPITSIEAQVSGVKCLFSNAITREVCLSDSAKFLPIASNDINLWVSEILAQNNSHKNLLRSTIKRYDIDHVAKQLETLYEQFLHEAYMEPTKC